MLLSISSALIGQNETERGYIVSIGDSAPEFSLEFTDSSKTTMDDLKGDVIMLQFTASWCSVCRKEMPHIEKEIWNLYKEFGLKVIGIDKDEPLETVQNFAKETHITYPLALDPKAEIFSLFAEKESGVTRNVIINPEGKIVFLTRLYDPIEFENMIQVIHSELEMLLNQRFSQLESNISQFKTQLIEFENKSSEDRTNLSKSDFERMASLSDKLSQAYIIKKDLQLKLHKLKTIRS